LEEVAAAAKRPWTRDRFSAPGVRRPVFSPRCEEAETRPAFPGSGASKPLLRPTPGCLPQAWLPGNGPENRLKPMLPKEA
jgi:hypothetical protein